MKNLLILIGLMLSIHTASFAQCKELKEKKDDFSDKKERTGSVIIGNLFTKWKIDFAQSEDGNFMTWGIAMQGEFNRVFEAGTLMLFKLEDGTMLRLNTMEPTSPVTQAIGGGGSVQIFTTYLLKFQLDDETVRKFALSPIDNFKVEVPGLSIKNPPIKGKQMGNIQDVFQCMVKGLKK
ncbi:MAG TPA: hypothetical protein PL009_13720 [Flavipsychrobacter sp.]|nr:hypothetical protein [Flavipsychrobacter sp.]